MDANVFQYIYQMQFRHPLLARPSDNYMQSEFWLQDRHHLDLVGFVGLVLMARAAGLSGDVMMQEGGVYMLNPRPTPFRPFLPPSCCLCSLSRLIDSPRMLEWTDIISVGLVVVGTDKALVYHPLPFLGHSDGK